MVVQVFVLNTQAARASGRSPGRFEVGPGPPRPSAAGSPESRRHRPRRTIVPAAMRSSSSRAADRRPHRHRPELKVDRRKSARSRIVRLGRARAGSTYAKAAFTLTPPSMLTGSTPNPIPPSRSSRLSRRVQGPRGQARRGRFRRRRRPDRRLPPLGRLLPRTRRRARRHRRRRQRPAGRVGGEGDHGCGAAVPAGRRHAARVQPGGRGDRDPPCAPPRDRLERLRVGARASGAVVAR